MLFKRIAIRNFRRLQQPVRIDGLAPGLNVIAGDNEEGKSTVLRALRAALFDKHTLSGNAAAAFQPYGSQVRPEIEVEFELAGKTYRLRKGFCQRPSAELSGPDGTHTGPAAEDRLRELLGFDKPDRGPPDARHHGTWGLLWVEQGAAFAPLLHNERSKRTLLGTLESEVGDILGGQQGYAILEQVRQAHADFFTKTGQPRGEYRAAKKAVEELTAELDKVEAALQAYESKVDRLQRLRDELHRWDSEDIVAAHEVKLRQAEQAHAALDQLREAVERSEDKLQLAQAHLNTTLQRWHQRSDLTRDLAVLEKHCQDLQRQLDAARAALDERQPRLDALIQAEREAGNAVAAARLRLAALEAAQRRQELERQLAEQRKRRQAARAAAEAANAPRRPRPPPTGPRPRRCRPYAS